MLAKDNVFAVADGMGGHAGGEVAARVAVETIESVFARNPTAGGLKEAIETANQTIWRQSRERNELRGMGTTLTAAALARGPDQRELMVLANVGDSRAYLLSGGQLRQLTADHSLAEERVRHGEITEAEAAVHPHRHILTRALGVTPEVDVDLWELHVHSGDRLLLCSDGLTNEVDAEKITAVLASVQSPQEAAAKLVDEANAHGGNDNITVVVVDVLSGEEDESASRAVPIAWEFEDRASGERPGSNVQGFAGKGPPAGRRAVDATEMLGAVTTAVALPPAGSQAPAVARRTGLEEDQVLRGRGTAAVIEAGNGPTKVSDDVFVAAPPIGTGPKRAAAEPRAVRAEQGRVPAWKESRRERLRRLGVPRRITIRVVAFLFVLVAVVVGGYVFVRWYANDNWFVTIDHGQLVIYRGHPGGLAWFRPTIVERTGVSASQVLPSEWHTLVRDVNEPSLSAARRYVTNLHQEFCATQSANVGSTQSPGQGHPKSGTNRSRSRGGCAS